jgi:hypothetical protein
MNKVKLKKLNSGCNFQQKRVLTDKPNIILLYFIAIFVDFHTVSMDYRLSWKC